MFRFYEEQELLYQLPRKESNLLNYTHKHGRMRHTHLKDPSKFK